MTWKYSEAFGFQVLPSHLEEFYLEECKLNLEINWNNLEMQEIELSLLS